MATKEIPRDQWIKFFNEFSKQHEGWIVTMDVIGSDIGDQEEAAGLPLVGISADLKDKANRIEIILGGRPDADLTRIVNNPKQVWFKDSEEVGDEAIEVESDDDVKTLFSVRHIPPNVTERQLPREN